MAKITAPDAANMPGEHRTFYGPVEVVFVDGKADVPDLPDAVKRYMLSTGYTVDGESFPAPDAPSAPIIDARDATPVQVGTPGQDGAVDPQPGDFLPPVNAGEADPHGPTVVAPGIHAEGERVVRSGPVSSDPAQQSADEQVFAEQVLVEQKPIEAPVDGGDFLEQGGPLGLSDPGSAQVGEEQADESGTAAGDAAVTTVGEPKGNASQREWAAYAVAQGADPEVAANASRDDLRAEYGA